MNLHESGENYLETILLLKKQKGEVRSVDIANELDYSKPSVSRAVGILRDNGYITVENNGLIYFTEKGLTRAEGVYERHRIIGQYLMMTLGLDPAVADADACRIEHIISPETFERIKIYVADHGDKS
jgi:DtxR family Mn-dependent transcriptional regulator